MPSIVVVGSQWGDEGKGKIVDVLSKQASLVVRAQGGNNAGHTVVIDSKEHKLHLVPSGILHPHTRCYIGAGTVIDPKELLKEIKTVEASLGSLEGRLFLSPAAHIIFPYHRSLDALLEKRKGKQSVGTTGRGIGPCYADKANRLGIRLGELIREEIFPSLLQEILPIKNEELKQLYNSEACSYTELLAEYSNFASLLKPFVADVGEIASKAIEQRENVLFEGAQGTFLDLTSGTYPYVTSSHTVVGGICTGIGIGPKQIDHTLGVFKAYTTRVGNGPLPTEILGEAASFTSEFGATTGRPRRIGWFDAVLAKTAKRLNGLESMAITKLDILDTLDEINICTGYRKEGQVLTQFPSLAQDLFKVEPIYEVHPGWKQPTSHLSHFEELPPNAQSYVERLSELCALPVSIISVGPERKQTITVHNPFAPNKVPKTC